jgi:epoxide hydrolase-like predicted phosphatase
MGIMGEAYQGGKMSIRAVIIDLGGVILRTENKEPRDRMAARFGLTRDQIDALVFDSSTAQLATLGKLPVEQHWAWVCRTLHLPVEAAADFEKEFFAGDSLNRRLVDYLRALRPRYATALLSNAWSGTRERLENDWGILDAFDQVVISAEVGLAKPDPRIFDLTLERLKATAAQAVFVDDFLDNTGAAAATGLHAVRFINTDQAITDIDALLRI